MSLTRQEFEDSLTNTFRSLIYQDTNKEFEEAFLTNSKSYVDVLATRYLRGQERINYYLNEWDNASTQSEKDAVVGSVVGDLGSASVNADDVYSWPPDGRFGDMLSQNSSPILNESYFASVNGKTVGNTSIFTAQSGKKFIPMSVDFILDQVVGLSIVSTVSIGTNASSYNNLYGATLLTGLTTAGNRINFPLDGLKPVISGDTEVFCRVSIGSTATTYDLIASVSGYYI